MQLLDELLVQLLFRVVNDKVYAFEMVDGLQQVIYIDGLFCYAYRIGLKDIACLVMSKSASLNMVRIVSKVNLDTMIDAPLELGCLLFSESPQNG